MFGSQKTILPMTFTWTLIWSQSSLYISLQKILPL